VGDREISSGWVAAGRMPDTPLKRAGCHSRQWQAYQAGLAGFFYDTVRTGGYSLVLSYPVQDGPSVAAAVVAQHMTAQNKAGQDKTPQPVPFLSPKAIGFEDATCRDHESNVPSCLPAGSR
jgi:hypothetical protein